MCMWLVEHGGDSVAGKGVGSFQRVTVRCSEFSGFATIDMQPAHRQ